MKKSILLATVVSVALSSVPAMAENPAPFHAMSQMSMNAEGGIPERGIRELGDAELAQVEGGLIQIGLMAGIAAFGAGVVLGAVIADAIWF